MTRAAGEGLFSSRLKRMATLPVRTLARALGVTVQAILEVTGGPSMRLTLGPTGTEVVSQHNWAAPLPQASVPIMYRGEPVGSVGLIGSHIKKKDASRAVGAIAATLEIYVECCQAASQAITLGEDLERARREMFRRHEDVMKLVAMDVHDAISQHLAFLYFQIQLFEGYVTGDSTEARHRFDLIRDLARSLVEDTARLLLDLRPPHLDDLGLVPALNRYIESFSKQSGIPVQCSVSGDWRRTTDFRAVALYRIVQEALNNTWKHALASRVSVSLQAVPGRLMVTVADDGIGFDAEATPKQPNEGGFGIYTMGERAALCGGEIQIKSRPGHGCAVHVALPEGSSPATNRRR